MSAAPSSPWIFSRAADLAAFGGSALASLLALLVGRALGLLDAQCPPWAWIAAVLLVDVAHVHLTFFRVYLDPAELRRHRARYALLPLLAFALGAALYRVGPPAFWRALAYVAVFHFVRQQAGWMRLYHRRAGALPGWRRALDLAAVYLGAIYPLVWWHAHLPRRFEWFVDGDFVALPPPVATALAPVYAATLAAYAALSLAQWARGERAQAGRDLLVVTNALCWYVGIVAFDSDYAFTVTNVLIHGVPYFVLVYRTGRARRPAVGVFRRAPWVLLGAVWAVAFLEEFFWDRAVWGERPWLFGSAWSLDAWRGWIVPLLAVPQLTHYVLDGFIWRRRESPEIEAPPPLD
ncbi:MAG: hypothetical protein JWM10_4764 [Myxococcaceae bacterium]|nr:hypothetical protein [Myxococcaceae bacterium]